MVINTESLSFTFGNQQVVKSVSLRVPAGSIYGFLGPNGAGKTTTIKLLLNLLRPDQGSIHIFDLELPSNREAILAQTGSLIEQPAIYAHMTGRENLKNRAMLLQVPETRIEEMLALVQLKPAADKKAGRYSLGMKQRLGIALALLGDPKLLILDEPTNGLDPNGIIEIRELLVKLTQEHGKTVFISSHLLAEINKMATHVGIIHQGSMMFQGSIDELEALNKPMIEIEVAAKPEEAAALLQAKGYTVSDIKNDKLLVAYTSKAQMGQLNAMLYVGGFTVYSITKVQKDLESLFLAITQNTKA